MTDTYTRQLLEWFRPHADEDTAGPMAAYMRNRFAFLGIKTPQRTGLLKGFLDRHGLPDSEMLETVVRQLWSQPEREFHYVALTLLDKHKKKTPVSRIDLLEELITDQSWWDTVDALAGGLVGFHFSQYPQLIPSYRDNWLLSDNLWLNRTAILFQLHYKQRTDSALLFDAIRRCSDSNEFFIRKAIGWALREYSKTDEAAVRSFVAETELSSLSVREALKYVERNNAEREASANNR